MTCGWRCSRNSWQLAVGRAAPVFLSFEHLGEWERNVEFCVHQGFGSPENGVVIGAGIDIDICQGRQYNPAGLDAVLKIAFGLAGQIVQTLGWGKDFNDAKRGFFDSDFIVPQIHLRFWENRNIWHTWPLVKGKTSFGIYVKFFPEQSQFHD